MLCVGVIVNPIAGIGGPTALKGSDGAEVVQKAFDLGAELVAPSRAVETLSRLAQFKDEFILVTYPVEMGEQEARQTGIDPLVIGVIQPGKTTASDTRQAALEMAAHPVDLILFAGGDGTARDVYNAIGDRVPVLGIPAGVKIHSSVYAINPRRAADVVREFLGNRAPLRELEVMDIDEEQFRQGRVSARLYGYLKVPYEQRYVQGAKSASAGGGDNAFEIAQVVIDEMNDETWYLLGPGTTVKAIGDLLEIDKTLLGVDLVYQGRLVGKDLSEKQIYEQLDERKFKLVITVIGGQGNIFGRGNQQFSPRVIRKVGKENIIVVATQDKLLSLSSPLLVDTGEAACDEYLSGYVRIVVGYKEQWVRKVES